MTKQEHIEEMISAMAASNNPFVDVPIEIMPKVAEALYNAGYRKVLLDTEDGKMVDCVQYAPWQLIKGYTEREVNKARKETAKEIFQDLYHDALLNTGDTVELTKLEIETLAKRYGVEVED